VASFEFIGLAAAAFALAGLAVLLAVLKSGPKPVGLPGTQVKLDVKAS
jgi:hypothetical protein